MIRRLWPESAATSEITLNPCRWILHGLHLGLTVAMPLLLLTLLGCKQAKETKENLGPEVPSEKVSDLLAEASNGANLDGIAKGQYVRMVHTRRIENSETVVDLGSRTVEVLDRQDTADSARITMYILEMQRLNNGTFLAKETEDEYELQKTATADAPQGVPYALATPLYMRMSSPEALIQKLRQGVTATASGERITFHKLKQSTATIDVPPAVRLRPDCGGLSRCELKVRYVQFSMVLWEDNDTYQKINFDFAFSVQTPYLPYGRDFEQLNGVMITDCRSTYVPIESRTVYVRDCFDLNDFKK